MRPAAEITYVGWPRRPGRRRTGGYTEAVVDRVLHLVYHSTMTYEAVAAETGLTKGQVSGIVFRNRRNP